MVPLIVGSRLERKVLWSTRIWRLRCCGEFWAGIFSTSVNQWRQREGRWSYVSHICIKILPRRNF
ncbi:hypothetical protein YC2023_061414 [Brassica napus]|uniref:(rape) hypothetical protein n=1 Tax=Brassica napus TaxID=3708 RepID=A0A816L683_BRANA|nr:unnamed protein product [Brassica napus]